MSINNSIEMKIETVFVFFLDKKSYRDASSCINVYTNTRINGSLI